jgi:F-type H+-transporting ATPase subunit b
VRYESQVKQRQQKELAESIIAKVQKELENPKVLQQILQQSVADVESELRPSLLLPRKRQLTRCRNRLFQGSIDGCSDRVTSEIPFVPVSIHTSVPIQRPLVSP